MKAGILTFPNSVSYGAVLQMYALYHSLEKMGCAAEIINYHNAYMKAELHVAQLNKRKSLVAKWQKFLKNLMHYRMYAAFHKFEKNKMKIFPTSSIKTKEDLCKLAERYDAVICGSDQVWNPDITGADTSYFLDFCGEKTKRISYAPSFGVETLSKEFGEAIKEELQQFSQISVREESGQRILQNLLQFEFPLVVDPTLLMDSNEWSALEKKHSVAKEDFILYYTIRHTDSLFRFCMELSEKTGMKVVVVGGNFFKKLRNRNKRIVYANDIGPAQWLYLLHRARYVVTNSFHGTAFSINYRKDFYVEFSSLTNSRLSHIIRTFDLEDRVVKNEIPVQIRKIDYSKTETLLPELRKKSAQFLKEALF